MKCSRLHFSYHPGRPVGGDPRDTKNPLSISNLSNNPLSISSLVSSRNNMMASNHYPPWQLINSSEKKEKAFMLVIIKQQGFYQRFICHLFFIITIWSDPQRLFIQNVDWQYSLLVRMCLVQAIGITLPNKNLFKFLR